MKKFPAILTLLLPALLLQGCAESLPGTNTITGRLLNNCEAQQPMANQVLYFMVDDDTPDEERIAYTDENGFFSYSFEGPASSNSVLGGTIRINESRVILAGIGGYGTKADAGDIYLTTPTHIQMNFKINGTGFQEGDSLFIAKVWPVRFPTLKIAWPFEKVTVDTLWTRYATTAAGTMQNYTTMNKPNVRRLNGSFGSVCYWEIRKNGAVLKEGRNEVTFSACDTVAEMVINLNE